MNPNTETPVSVGEAWTDGDPPTRETIQPGVNSPEIKGIGWRREMAKLKMARGRY